MRGVESVLLTDADAEAPPEHVLRVQLVGGQDQAMPTVHFTPCSYDETTDSSTLESEMTFTVYLDDLIGTLNLLLSTEGLPTIEIKKGTS